MHHVDYWTWKCLRCDFKAMDKFTVNRQQCVAEAIVRLHIQSHAQPPSIDAVDPSAQPQERPLRADRTSPTSPRGPRPEGP